MSRLPDDYNCVHDLLRIEYPEWVIKAVIPSVLKGASWHTVAFLQRGSDYRVMIYTIDRFKGCVEPVSDFRVTMDDGNYLYKQLMFTRKHSKRGNWWCQYPPNFHPRRLPPDAELTILKIKNAKIGR